MRSSLLPAVFLLLYPVLPQPAQAQWGQPRTIEYRAMDEVYAYYVQQRVPPNHVPRQRNCIGITVWDCFKGDFLCVEFRSCDRDDYVPKRKRIIELLDSAAIEIKDALGLGGDLRWVDGQRVAFRLADRKFEEAAHAARDCTASDWWCAALRGYVAQLQNQYVLAEREYRASARFMPQEVRCEWLDLSTVYGFSDAYEKIADECKALPISHPIWELWDPLFLLPGNDRMTEHFARLTAIQLRRDALLAVQPESVVVRTPELVQRGLWDSWVYRGVRGRVPEQRGRPTRTTVRTNRTTVSHYVIVPRHERSGLRLIPSVAMATRPFLTTSDDWRIRTDNGSDQYLPAYGTIGSLSAVTAWLFRDNSGVLLVRAASNGSGSQRHRPGTKWQTVLWDGIEYHHFEVTQPSTTPTTVARIPLGGYVVSMEAILPDSGALRARLGAMSPVADSMRVSDLVLVRADPGTAPTAEEVAAQMLPTAEWRRDAGPLRLYWEYYLPQSATTASVRLEVLQQADGIWSTVTSVFGVTPQTRSMSWTDELAESGAPHRGRSVAVDVSALPAGSYRMRLTVTAANQVPVSVERMIELR